METISLTFSLPLILLRFYEYDLAIIFLQKMPLVDVKSNHMFIFPI